ncbi:hypothetical protein Tco_0010501 [Tanacetum coccineum]
MMYFLVMNKSDLRSQSMNYVPSNDPTQEASEDDDGVLDKLSLDSRFKALKVLEVDNEMASKDDDGVLDKLSLDSRFKAMKVKHLNKGVELEAWKKESSGSDGPIRRIHGLGYGVLNF